MNSLKEAYKQKIILLHSSIVSYNVKNEKKWKNNDNINNINKIKLSK